MHRHDSPDRIVRALCDALFLAAAVAAPVAAQAVQYELRIAPKKGAVAAGYPHPGAGVLREGKEEGGHGRAATKKARG